MLNFYKNIGYHCVLTYSKPPKDTDEVYHDFKTFWQKVRYRYPNMGYISVFGAYSKWGLAYSSTAERCKKLQDVSVVLYH